MSSDVYQRVKHTMFKKGDKPHNTQPVGTIHFRTDKAGRTYAYIKIKDKDWRLMHRVVWEQHNGPIPPGHVIRFKDGNTMNWDINNLEMFHQSGNMELNTIQRFPAELQEVKVGLFKQIESCPLILIDSENTVMLIESVYEQLPFPALK